MLNRYLSFGFVLLASLLLSCSSGEKAPPNFIFILADDLGYMDIGAYAERLTGTPVGEQYYETPNLDRLVAEGLPFSQAYANQLCAPTRAALLTGKYAGRLGFTTAVPGGTPTYYNKGETPPQGYHPLDVIVHQDRIPTPQALINGRTQTALYSGDRFDQGRNETTLAEALSGYHSAFLGKWHLGGQGASGYQPHNQGFQTIAYFDAGGSPYFNWRDAWNRRELIHPKMDQDSLRMGMAGAPTGKEYLTDDLTNQALHFLDQRANTPEQPFLLYFCHFALHGPIQAKQADIDYFEHKTTKGWNGHKNATYAAMLKSLDESVGALMQKLKDTGMDENTYLVFMSDNGGVDWLISGKDNPPPTSNAPLKGGKATLFEGGVRVPLVFWHKNQIKGGQWSDIPVNCTDLFPTLLDLAGRGSESQEEIDGQSLVPLFEDLTNTKGLYTKDTIYWHYPFNVIVNNPDDGFPLTPHSAIRAGDYKLIYDWHGRLKLYNIPKDQSETHNLASEEPKKTKALFAALMRWMEQNVEEKYLPIPNPNYDPAMEVRDEPFVNLYKAYRAKKGS